MPMRRSIRSVLLPPALLASLMTLACNGAPTDAHGAAPRPGAGPKRTTARLGFARATRMRKGEEA